MMRCTTKQKIGAKRHLRAIHSKKPAIADTNIQAKKHQELLESIKDAQNSTTTFENVDALFSFLKS